MVKSKAIKVQQDCTLCVMKPHLLKSGRTGELFEYIVTGGFEVVGVFLTHMTIPIVEGLFDIYRGVFDKYAAMIDELSSAPVLAVMLRKESTFNNSVIEFREYCGPVNPLLAKILRPKSLRAIFGEDIVRNAVHCTDLDTDGPLECQYFFDTLANI